MSGSWKLEVPEEGIGVLVLDEPGTEVNVLTSENLTELKKHLQDIQGRNDLKVLLIRSAKKRIFIAGADIKEIRCITTEEDAYNKAEQGKEVFQLLEDLPVPTVTLINGPCLGGGYELALATDYRIASFSAQIKIGLPEVNLGILPGFGGSIRLPRLIGLIQAMPLLLAGKMLSPDKALKSGLVDRLYPEKTLLENAMDFARELAGGSRPEVRRRKKNWITGLMEGTAWGRSIVFRRARKDVLKKTKGFYPAPLEILDLLKKTYGSEGLQPFRTESSHFAKLGATEVSKNLIKLFFMSERYKKLQWTKVDAADFKVSKVGVVGAGVMGGGIAQRVSYRDIPVRVKDINEQALAGALKEAASIYSGALKRRRMTRFDVMRRMTLISVGLTNQGLKNCDVIVEAVVEDLNIKKRVFQELGEITEAHTVLASNTSSLPVTKMAESVRHPERVVGVHFFNPVHLMPLVEVIRAEKTSDETVEKAVLFSRLLGKTVIVTRDTPGFVVNRLLLPYLNEAAYLLEEGIAPEDLDRIAVKFGMPMGPIELVDQVGIDVAYKVAHILQDAFGSRMQVASILEDVRKQGLLGRKSGKGFYLYNGRKKSPNREIMTGRTAGAAVSDEDILKRLVYVMINEAARCLEEKVVDEPSSVDIGMVMGTGFPPFHAGLLHYADSIGLAEIVADLERFAAEVSEERFAVSPYLKTLAEKGTGFYGI